jgi:PKHD-type hydroxylase
MQHLWYVFPNVYTKEQCKEISMSLRSANQTTYVDQAAPGKKVNTNVISVHDVACYFGKLFELVEFANEEIFGFEVFDHLPRTINYNCYSDENNEYPFHKDSTDYGSSRDIKLTAILNISTQPYTGGEFEYFDCEINRIEQIDQPGSLLVFPSFVFHRVKPVTSGMRETVSVWFNGPNWK